MNAWAMTAAGLDYVSGGRFSLGLGASGPQVIEGFHGVKYDAPLGRTREVIDICRQVWRRERVTHDGKHYQITDLQLLPGSVQTPRIPIWVAAAWGRPKSMRRG